MIAIVVASVMMLVAMVVFWQHIVRRLSPKAFAKIFSIQNGPSNVFRNLEVHFKIEKAMNDNDRV